MEQSPCLEAIRFAASQEIPCILWNPKVHYQIQKCLPIYWASSIQSITPHPTSWRSILLLSSNLHLVLPVVSFPQVSPPKTLYTPFLSPIRATCPAHLILLDFITWTILGEEYRSLRSSLCSFLHSSVTPSLLGPNILKTLSSNTQPMFLPQCQRLSVTPIHNNRQNYSSVYLNL